MGLIDDVKSMRRQGRTDDEIRQMLKQQGYNLNQVDDAMSQSRIKDAISQQDLQQQNSPQNTGSSQQNNAPTPQDNQVYADSSPMIAQSSDNSFQRVGGGTEATQGSTNEYSSQSPQGYEGMQPSMMGAQQQQATQEYGGNQGYSSAYGYPEYQQYQSYQDTMSSDIISEISEQVVSEKLAGLNDKFEKAADFRTTAEAKIEALDERLKRIEKIIDKLQISILQRVSDYVTDVKDIKKEIQETQKSFKSVNRAREESHKQPNSQTHSKEHHTKHVKKSHVHKKAKKKSK